MVSLLVISLVVLALSTPTFAIETMNMFRATQSGASKVAANTWTNALCLANDSTDAGTTRDMLVVASFSQSSNGGPAATSTADYQLVLKDINGSTFSNTQQRFLSGGSDEGNGMLAWLFTAVPGAATNTCDSAGTRFVLQHKRSTGTTTLSTSNISIVAVPLDNANISMDWWRAKQSDSFSTSSSSFVPVPDMSGSVTIDNINGPRGAYVVATFSTELGLSIGVASSTGEWTLQGSTDNSTWNDIGSQIERTHSASGQPGIAQLTALVEGIDAGSYYFRLASRRSAGTGSLIVTKGGHIAAVSLVFDDQNGSGDGYFPWFNDTLSSPDCDYKSDNALDRMYGNEGGTCTSTNKDPLTDTFTMSVSSDVFMTFVIGADFPEGDSADGVGTFESQIWDGVHPSGTNVFGKDTNGPSQEVSRDFVGALAKGAMGQVALWDTTDADNASGTYYAYGGWAINGNALNTEDATIVGWVGRSVAASRAFITGFNGIERNGQTSIEWSTVAERGTIGYRLFRQDTPDDPWWEVTSGLVPGMMDAPQGGNYAVADPDARVGGSYTYLVEEEDMHSGKRRYGPFTITVLEGSDAALAFTDGKDYFRQARTVKPKKANRSNNSAKAIKPKTSKQSNHVEKSPGPEVPPLVDTRFRLQVETPGLQFVSAADLANASGVSQKEIEKLIRQGRLSLNHHGTDVAWLPWDKDDGLLFYAEGLKTLYTDRDVYWLQSGPGTLMASKGGRKPSPGSAAGVFTDTIRYDPDEFAAPGWVSDPTHDFWFWQFMLGGYSDFDTASLNIKTPGAYDLGGNAHLKVFFYGLSDESVGDDHHVELSVDGRGLANARWDGLGPQAAVLSFPQGGNLIDGDNQVELTALLDAGQSKSWAYLDAVEITYARRYQALENALLLRGDDNDTVTATGFNTKDILVIDVSNPMSPRRINALSIGKSNEGFSVTFIPGKSSTPYMLATSDGFVQPEISVTSGLPDLRDKSHSADYLVIAPGDLLAAGQTLVNYRQGQGLRGMAVDVQHVYDDFNSGVVDATAIRDFLSYAYNEWSQRPLYVTLMGRGTQDRLNVLGLNDNLIPTNWISTPEGLSPTDSPYADLVTGDKGAWEIAVSRLPVVDAYEASDVVAKLIAYESGTALDRVLLSADNPDPVADFTTFSNKLAAGFDELLYDLKTVHMEDPPIGVSHQQDLTDQLQQGALFWHWAGHGAYDRLATEPLMTSASVDALTNADALPVLTSTTCLVNQFDYPGDPSLGERLVAHPTGGVIASFSPTSASITGQGAILSFAFRDALLHPGVVRVGDAALEASRKYAQDGFLGYLGSSYILLGDAASVVNK